MGHYDLRRKSIVPVVTDGGGGTGDTIEKMKETIGGRLALG